MTSALRAAEAPFCGGAGYRGFREMGLGCAGTIAGEAVQG
jgi:hypothetical protein